MSGATLEQSEHHSDIIQETLQVTLEVDSASVLKGPPDSVNVTGVETENLHEVLRWRQHALLATVVCILAIHLLRKWGFFRAISTYQKRQEVDRLAKETLLLVSKRANERAVSAPLTKPVQNEEVTAKEPPESVFGAFSLRSVAEKAAKDSTATEPEVNTTAPTTDLSSTTGSTYEPFFSTTGSISEPFSRTTGAITDRFSTSGANSEASTTATTTEPFVGTTGSTTEALSTTVVPVVAERPVSTVQRRAHTRTTTQRPVVPPVSRESRESDVRDTSFSAIRQQQDEEYNLSLQRDREKELERAALEQLHRLITYTTIMANDAANTDTVPHNSSNDEEATAEETEDARPEVPLDPEPERLLTRIVRRYVFELGLNDL